MWNWKYHGIRKYKHILWIFREAVSDPGLREHCKRRIKECKSRMIGRGAVQCCLLQWQGCCNHELPAAVVACICQPQLWHEWERYSPGPIHCRELWTADSCRRRWNHVILRLCLLLAFPWSSGWPHNLVHICTALIGSSMLQEERIEKEKEEKVRRRTPSCRVCIASWRVGGGKYRVGLIIFHVYTFKTLTNHEKLQKKKRNL